MHWGRLLTCPSRWFPAPIRFAGSRRLTSQQLHTRTREPETARDLFSHRYCAARERLSPGAAHRGLFLQRYQHDGFRFHSDTSTSLAKQPPRPPQGRDFPLKTPHDLQSLPRSGPPFRPLPCPWPQSHRHVLDRCGQSQPLPCPWPRSHRHTLDRCGRRRTLPIPWTPGQPGRGRCGADRWRLPLQRRRL